MRDTVNLQKFLREERNNIDAKGHCRIDYTDPITGKVLERIEGDNHVFMDQFMATDFQSNNLACSLLITDGDKELDTDLPWIPGRPIGYGNVDSAATGIYQGSFRSVDSYRNRITQQGVTSLYVYDFFTTQIPDIIRYVGLTANSRVNAPDMPIIYRWPQDYMYGIYDIERKKLFSSFTCSLSEDAGGAGSLYFYEIENEPAKTSIQRNIFDVCGRPDNYWSGSYYSRGYEAAWGYDYENQYVVLKLMRYKVEINYRNLTYYYTFTFQDDFWVLNKDATEVVKHFTYKWTADEGTSSSWQYYYDKCWAGNRFSPYFRLYGDKAYFFSTTPPNYADTAYNNVYYVYQYDITTGDSSYERTNTGHNLSHILTGTSSILYCYKGYTFCQSVYTNDSKMCWGFTSTGMSVNPMYDVYNDEVYTYCPVCVDNNYTSYYLLEKGQSSVYDKTWNMKPYLGGNDRTARPSMPFALTAYQLPADAPARPKNSAVTIAYGLDIKW